jgi:hypothetical protein
MDGGIAEHAMGWVNSEDIWGSWSSLMTTYARQKNFCAANPTLIFAHINITDDGRDFYRTTPYQAVRYGLASCLMANGQYAISPTAIGGNMTLTNSFTNSEYDTQKITGTGQWFDEFSVNPSTLVSYGYNDVNIATGMGWMGTPIDSEFPGVWQNGMYRRRFQMSGGRQAWVIINPAGNGTQTATYGQRMQAFLGVKETTVNSGNTNITSESIGAADARIRITWP